jgi:hypothetical protein
MGSKRKFKEFVTDPSSGEYSASRLLLMVMILIYLPILGLLDYLGIKMGIWSHFAVMVGSIAGVYGVNTAGRVWRSGVNPTPMSIPGEPQAGLRTGLPNANLPAAGAPKPDAPQEVF